MANNINEESLKQFMAGWQGTIISPNWGATGRIEVDIHDLPENDMSEFEKADKQLRAYVTPTLYAKFEKAMEKAGDTEKSAAVRAAIVLYCETHGIKDADGSVSNRGGFKGNENSIEALKRNNENRK